MKTPNNSTPDFRTYNDKVPTPEMSRVAIAASKFVILGTFAEIQLISPGGEYRPEGVTMYHLFTSPDLKHCTTCTIERLTLTKARVTLKGNGPETALSDSEEDKKVRSINARTKVYTVDLPVTGKTGDADLILAAQKAHFKFANQVVREVFGFESFAHNED